MLRDGEMVDGVEKAGTPKDRWPPLCEDLEAGLDPDSKVTKSLKRALDHCVRWAGLWTAAAGDVPTRQQILNELEAERAK